MPKVDLNPMITQSVTKLKNDITYSALLGKYKDYVAAKKAYANFGVDNFELCKNTPGANVTVPFFSKFGMNMFKVWFLDKFRIKTKNEKQFKKIALEELAKQKINNR